MKNLESKILQKLTDPAMLNEFKSRCGRAALEFIQNQFEMQTNPYGTPWKPLKRDYGPRSGGILDRTGNMRSSFQMRVSEGKFTIYNTARNKRGHKYFGVHQNGAPQVNVPRRQVIPTQAQGLPKAWREEFGSILRGMIK